MLRFKDIKKGMRFKSFKDQIRVGRIFHVVRKIHKPNKRVVMWTKADPGVVELEFTMTQIKNHLEVVED